MPILKAQAMYQAQAAAKLHCVEPSIFFSLWRAPPCNRASSLLMLSGLHFQFPPTIGRRAMAKECKARASWRLLQLQINGCASPQGALGKRLNTSQLRGPSVPKYMRRRLQRRDVAPRELFPYETQLRVALIQSFRFWAAAKELKISNNHSKTILCTAYANYVNLL